MRFTRCAGLTYVILDNNLASHESACSLQDLASEVGAIIYGRVVCSPTVRSKEHFNKVP